MADNKADIGLSEFLGERDDLLALARSIVGQADMAEDIVQDSWIRWSQHNYPVERAKPFLRKIVANLGRDWLRKTKREADGLCAASLISEKVPDTERIIIGRQELLRVIAALKSLPTRTFIAFKMRRLDGASYTEIGNQLGVSSARACQLATKALARIAIELDDQG
ncbi:MAG: RNA polymerase sigma factor [Pseudomonadota bacterium]